MYAIVDIETTGGHASANGITEIAICIHDGKKITRRFETLVNPQRDIPVYIRALTGITNEMVQRCTTF
jgi:DNA polymerase-3 subunit epsilon